MPASIVSLLTFDTPFMVYIAKVVSNSIFSRVRNIYPEGRWDVRKCPPVFSMHKYAGLVCIRTNTGTNNKPKLNFH